MEHYTKGENKEEPLEREKIPIPGLSDNFLWMKVYPGTKIKNVVSFALKSFEGEQIVWSGSGPAVGKTISCAEIMKRQNKSLHQITKICYRKVEEFWEPNIEGLDQLVVLRDVPTIHILLSKTPLDSNELGYQAPGSSNAFQRAEVQENKKWSGHRKNNRATSSLGEQKISQQGSKRKKNDPSKKSQTKAPSSHNNN